MRIDEFCNWTFVHDLKADREKENIVFQTTKANLAANKYETNLEILNLNSGQIRKLTNADQDSLTLCTEDQQILFTSGRNIPDKDKLKDQKPEGKTFYWKIDPEGGEAEIDFAVDLHVSDIKELSADHYLVQGSKIRDCKKDWLEIDELPFWLNGAGYTQGTQNSIYLFDAVAARKKFAAEKKAEAEKKLTETLADPDSKMQSAEDQKAKEKEPGADFLKKISDEQESVSFFALSPDKTELLIVGVPHQKLMPLKENISLYNLQSGERKMLSEAEFQVYFIEFAGPSKAFMIATNCQKHGLNEDPFVYLIDTAKGTIERISPDNFDLSFGCSIGSDAKFGGGKAFVVAEEELYFLYNQRGKSGIAKIDSNGRIADILKSDGSITGFEVARDAIYYTAMENQELAEIYCYRFEKEEQGSKCQPGDSTQPAQIGQESLNGQIRKLTNYSNALQDLTLSPIEHFIFESNGAMLDGYVMLPANYDPSEKYPGLLEIHGGPKTSYGTVLFHEMQWLASEGYFVFFTNPHGSDSYGVEFSDIRGKYGSVDFDDLMNFTDLVLAKYPAIDTQKLGCLGGSYGGFMVNWIIGHSDRFAAANSQRSISNWLSFYGVSDIGFYFTEDQTLADLWQNPEKAWLHSPLKYTNQVKTPTLFIHSDQDYRCPLEQGIQMYAALLKQGVEAKLTVFKNENHELSRSGKPQARIKRLAEIGSWFGKYLK